MKIVAAILLCGCLFGCATGPQPPVNKEVMVNTDDGPQRMTYIFWEDRDTLGLNHKGCDLIDNKGKFVTRSSASAPGPVPGLVGQAAQSGATTAVAGAIIPMLTGSGATNTTSVKVSTGAK